MQLTITTILPWISVLNLAHFKWIYTDKIADSLFLFGICLIPIKGSLSYKDIISLIEFCHFKIKEKPAASKEPGFTECQRLEEISKDHLIG